MTWQRDDAIFSRLSEKGIIGANAKKAAKGGPRVPDDVVYTPPTGKRLFSRYEKIDLQIYTPGTPTSQTDLLQDCERQFILPFAVPMSLAFRTPPLTDDAYRFIPEETKDESLFFLLSRTNVHRVEDGFISWTPIVVVIKRMIVVKVRCLFHPTKRKFMIKRVRMWQNKTNSYYIVEDVRLTKEVVLNMIARYIELEGIFKAS